MAIKRIRVKLPSDLRTACLKAGEMIVQDLRSPLCIEDALSAALSTHGAELDPFLQANAKAAECVFCLWAGFDPLRSLRWRHADSGYDIVWYSVFIDVKHTAHRNGRLIWPIGKNDQFERKNFDVFVLVTGHDVDFELCGWTTKATFLKHHRIAERGDGLSVGTWFMDQAALNEMAALPVAIEWMADNDPTVVMRGCF